jgi:L-lactate utilization protein LutC
MAQRYIYLSDELNERLKEEENVSQLIQKLLINHYNLMETPQERLKQVKREIEEKTKEAKQLIEQIEDIDKKKMEAFKEEMDKHDKKEIYELTALTRKSQREAFNNYIIPNEDKDNLFEEYFDLLQSKKVKNIVEFMDSKGFERKKPKVIS